MKEFGLRNLAVGAWRIARVGGWRVAAGQASRKWLPGICARLGLGLNGMEDVRRWFNEKGDYAVCSFDIYDTLLHRRIDPPESVKLLVAEHVSALLAQHGIYVNADEVLARRNEAERVLQQQSVLRGNDAVCYLVDIAQETLVAIKADSVLDSQAIVDYEVDLEKKATESMPGAKAVLTYLRSMGKRVICTSDSYLSAGQMAMILEHHGLLKFIDKLYISSDVGRSKLTKRLFEHVMEKEGSELVHVGDNYTFDYRMPRSLGIRALWFHSRSERRRKGELRKLRDGANKMNYVNAIVRSAARDDNAVYGIGYDVLGPGLTLFVHNVAEQARRDGIEAIFFIARDGYLMKKIYDMLRSNVYPDQSLPIGKYMCLGRVPVRLASVHKLSSAELSEVYGYMARDRRKDVTLGDILGSYGLEPSHFSSVAERYGIDMGNPVDDPTHYAKLNELLESTEFQRIMRMKADEARRLLRGYLVSIGFMGRRKVAVVDANAEGVTQSLLDRVFRNDREYPAVNRYYFNSLNLDVHRSGIKLDLPQVRGIVSDWRSTSRNEQRPYLLFGMLLELFGHPNHGVTVGYKDIEGRIIPVFRETSQESEYQLTSHALWGILSYARDYSMYYSLHNYNCEELLEHVKGNIRQWVAFPPKSCVRALKDLFVTSDWPQEINHKLMQQITFSDMLAVRRLRKKMASSMWTEASLTLAPVPGLNWLFSKRELVGTVLAKSRTTRRDFSPTSKSP